MATNPMLQSVLLFHNQQITAPYLPALAPPLEAARPKEEKDIPLEDDEEEEHETEENEESESESDG